MRLRFAPSEFWRVGSNAEIQKLAGTKTSVIDLQGRVVIPGINDAHTHFMLNRCSQLKFETMEPTWQKTIEVLEDAVKQTSKGHGFSVQSEESD